MISVLFYGTPAIAATSLAALLKAPNISIKGVVTQPDRPTGRKQVLTPSPVKLLALEHGIPIIQPERIKKIEAQFIDEIKDLGEIDIAVVVAFGQILPEAVLHVPKRGSLNLHASLLPRWRGAAPIQRALMAGDAETGVCLMQMDAGLDTGAVFVSTTIAISENDTAQTLHDAIAERGAALIVENIERIVSGALQAAPQPSTGVTYAEKITDQSALINWTQSAELVSCQIRALSPRPGAHTFLEGKRLKLFDPTVHGNTSVGAEPGTICEIRNEAISIQCAPGTLSVSALQMEGKKRISVSEYLRGSCLAPGEKLG